MFATKYGLHQSDVLEFSGKAVGSRNFFWSNRRLTPRGQVEALREIFTEIDKTQSNQVSFKVQGSSLRWWSSILAYYSGIEEPLCQRSWGQPIGHGEMQTWLFWASLQRRKFKMPFLLENLLASWKWWASPRMIFGLICFMFHGVVNDFLLQQSLANIFGSPPTRCTKWGSLDFSKTSRRTWTQTDWHTDTHASHVNGSLYTAALVIAATQPGAMASSPFGAPGLNPMPITQ